SSPGTTVRPAVLCWRIPPRHCWWPGERFRCPLVSRWPLERSTRAPPGGSWRGSLDRPLDPFRERGDMAQKVLLVADPGIDTAFAVALALPAPSLDVIGLVASAGNIPADRATQNVHLLINAIDPPKWPRLGAALPVTYEVDGTKLHGPDGLGNVELPPVSLHQPTPGDKVIVDLVREHPRAVTVIVLGPGTVLARAFDRDPELPALIDRIVFLGGAWRVPGNATAAAEFHFYCDPEGARQILRSGTPITLIPLDAARKLIFSPSDLLEL